MDFNQKGKIKPKELKEILEEIAKVQEGLNIEEVKQKRFTIFGLLKVKNPHLKQAFSIKLEVSTKKYYLKKEDYKLMICRSPVSPFTPLLFVYPLERMLKEKTIAVKSPGEPRDYFDLWFIKQKLGEVVKMPKPKIHPGKFKGEVSQLLPNHWKIWPKEFLEGKYE